jgi:hypothetical protein
LATQGGPEELSKVLMPEFVGQTAVMVVSCGWAAVRPFCPTTCRRHQSGLEQNIGKEFVNIS